MRVLIVLALFAACRHSPAPAVSFCPTVPLTDEPLDTRYLPCQLSRAPVAFAENAAPRYPDMLAGAGLQGSVRLSFIIDTAGRYVPGSTRVLESAHEQFTSSARFVVPGWRFTPGLLNGRPVRVQLLQAFTYELPDGADLQERFDRSPPNIVRRVVDGVPTIEVRLAGEDTTLGPPPRPWLRDSLARAAIRAVAHTLATDFDRGRVAPGATLPLCLASDRDGAPSPAHLALMHELASPRVRVLSLTECPPTRESIAVVVGDAGPPPPPDTIPFVEPHRLIVRSVGIRRAGGPQVDLVDESGTGERYTRCVRSSPAGPLLPLRCFITAWGSH
jgi:TonB family protein